MKHLAKQPPKASGAGKVAPMHQGGRDSGVAVESKTADRVRFPRARAAKVEEEKGKRGEEWRATPSEVGTHEGAERRSGSGAEGTKVGEEGRERWWQHWNVR